MDLLQEYKELYYKEIEHSERLNNKINTCITFLTIQGSAQILLWTQLKNFEIQWYSILYLILCLTSLTTFIICLYKFYETYSGYEYSYFPIRDMALRTIETYRIVSEAGDPEENADKHIYNMYCERFLNDAITNMNCNICKNNRYKNLTNIICISFIITILTFASGVCIDYYETQQSKQNVEHIIIDGGDINVR